MKIHARENTTLQDLLLRKLGTASRTRVKKMIKYRQVTLNGQVVVRGDLPVAVGDAVVIGPGERPPADGRGDFPFPVLYEDAQVLAVEKPPGVLTSGAAAGTTVTLHRLVRQYVKENSGGTLGAYVVHRIDLEVSGIVLFAKSAAVQQRLKNDWAQTEKHYWALVEGLPVDARGTVTSWLKEDSHRRVYSTVEGEGAKRAVTHFRVVKPVEGCILLDVRLETGRKNQIRVHLADIGCPVVGDRRYGASSKIKRRIRLHGYLLRFPHPVDHRKVTINSPMPEDFLVLGPRDEKYK